MRRLAWLVLACLMVPTADALAWAAGSWEPAHLVRQAATRDPAVTRCYYRVTQGFRVSSLLGHNFSLTVEGVCPSRIEINFTLREWRQD